MSPISRIDTSSSGSMLLTVAAAPAPGYRVDVPVIPENLVVGWMPADLPAIERGTRAGFAVSRPPITSVSRSDFPHLAVHMTGTLSVDRASRDIAAELAPDEAGALDTYLALYQDDPAIVRRLARPAGGEATGFGVPGDSLAPYIVAVVSATFTYMGKPMADAVRAEATNWLRRKLTKTFDRAAAAAPEVSAEQRAGLTTEQLTDIRKFALKTALDFDLPKSKAGKLADVLVGRLARRDGR
jgi:hypothetical protein